MRKKLKCAICLSGHVRGAFYDCFLHKFIRIVSAFYDADIYIHTWDKSEAKKTYRSLVQSNTIPITEEIIINYFKDIPIKQIKIENEDLIKTRGKNIGNLGNTNMPIRGWKLMIHGMFECVDMAKRSSTDYDFIIRFRLDLFSRYHNIFGYTDPKINYEIRKKIKIIFGNNLKEIKNGDHNKVCWLNNRGYNLSKNSKLYIDNFYFGSLEKIHQLLSLMNSKKLDNIIENIQKTSFNGVSQEAYFYYINEAIENSII